VIRALLASLVLHVALLLGLALGGPGVLPRSGEPLRVSWRLPLGEGREEIEDRVVSLPPLPAFGEPVVALPEPPEEAAAPPPLETSTADESRPRAPLGVTAATLQKRLPRAATAAVPSPPAVRRVPEVAAAPSLGRLVLRSRPDVTPATNPREAWLRGIEGMVVVRLLVRVDGTAEPEVITVSSGSPVLDRDAFARAREYRFAPLQAPRRVDAPIRYVIRSP
jgi:protein TonB